MALTCLDINTLELTSFLHLPSIVPHSLRNLCRLQYVIYVLYRSAQLTQDGLTKDFIINPSYQILKRS